MSIKPYGFMMEPLKRPISERKLSVRKKDKKKKYYFPRLERDGRVQAIAQILRVTYNHIVRERNLKLAKRGRGLLQGYDIRKFDPLAEWNFYKLAVRLNEQGVDPALYIKVLSNYGRFRHTRYLPRPAFFCGQKGMDIYKWLMPKIRDQFPGQLESMDNSLVEKDNISSTRIALEILASLKIIRDVQKTHPRILVCDILYSQNALLSPWAIALATDYLTSSTFKALDKRDKKKILRCRAYLFSRRKIPLLMVVRQMRKYRPQCFLFNAQTLSDVVTRFPR
jgi:hypothetical protein